MNKPININTYRNIKDPVKFIAKVWSMLKKNKPTKIIVIYEYENETDFRIFSNDLKNIDVAWALDKAKHYIIHEA